MAWAFMGVVPRLRVYPICSHEIATLSSLRVSHLRATSGVRCLERLPYARNLLTVIWDW